MAGARDFFDYPRRRIDRLTHISTRHRYVFLAVPKSGCSVVKRVLQFSEVDGVGYDPTASVHDRSRSPLAVPVAGGFDLQEVFGTPTPYFRFGFVRNPYSRALSCYLDKIVGAEWVRAKRLPKLGFEPDEEVSFPAFLHRVAADEPRAMDVHWAPQHFLLGLGKVEYAFLGRFESFQADLDRVIEHLGLDVPAELVARQTGHSTGARSRLLEYYDDESIQLVRDIYREDFERLGYGFDLRFAG